MTVVLRFYSNNREFKIVAAWSCQVFGPDAEEVHWPQPSCSSSQGCPAKLGPDQPGIKIRLLSPVKYFNPRQNTAMS